MMKMMMNSIDFSTTYVQFFHCQILQTYAYMTSQGAPVNQKIIVFLKKKHVMFRTSLSQFCCRNCLYW